MRKPQIEQFGGITLKAAGLLNRLTGSRRSMPGFAAELLTGSPDAEIILPATPDRIEVGRLGRDRGCGTNGPARKPHRSIRRHLNRKARKEIEV